MAKEIPKVKEAPKPIEKKPFDIKVETTLPATLTFRVWAETPEEAAKLIKNYNPVDIKYRLSGRRDTKLTVYDAYQNIIRFVKNLVGGMNV